MPYAQCMGSLIRHMSYRSYRRNGLNHQQAKPDRKCFILPLGLETMGQQVHAAHRAAHSAQADMLSRDRALDMFCKSTDLCTQNKNWLKAAWGALCGGLDGTSVPNLCPPGQVLIQHIEFGCIWDHAQSLHICIDVPRIIWAEEPNRIWVIRKLPRRP